MRGRPKRVALAALVALGLLAAACGDDDGGGATATTAGSSTGSTTASSASSGPGTTAAPADDADIDPNGVLRIAQNLNSANLKLDPKVAPTGYHQLFDALYGSLLHKNEDGSYTPSMAESAEIVDAQTVEITLRDGLVFSDGTPLDAEAMKFNLERFATSGNRLGMRVEYASGIDTIEVSSPTSVTVHLKTKTAGVFYDLLSGPEFSMLSPTAINAGKDMNTAPVGAGPFVLEQLVPDQKMVLKKNPTYFAADEIKVAGLEYVQIGTVGPAAVNALQTDAVDIAPLTYQLGRSVSGSIKVLAFKHQSMMGIETCKKDAPLSDVKVRQALSFAIDRETLGAALYGPDDVEPAWGLKRKDDPAYNPSLEGDYAFDPTKAKQLLTEAGYPNGFSTSMVVAPGLSQTAGEVIQANWKDIGVDLALNASTNVVQDFYLDTKSPMFPIAYVRAGIDVWTVRFVTGAFANVCGYANPELEAQVRAIMADAPGSDQSNADWRKLSELTAAQLPIFPLVFHIDYVGYNSDNVGGLSWHLSEFAQRIPTFEGAVVLK